MDDRKPTLVSRRTVFSGKIVELSIERIRAKNQDPIDMEIVRHPGSVVILAMPDERHILLVRQYRHAIGGWLWELPAGRLDPREPTEAAARRECHEETGLRPARLECLGTFYPTPGYCDEFMAFFRATGLTRAAIPERPDEHEVLEVRRFSIDEAARLTRNDEASDMKTALGLRLLRRD